MQVLQVYHQGPASESLTPHTLPEKTRSRVPLISNLQVGKVKATFTFEDSQQIAVEEDLGSLLGELDLGPGVADLPDAI